MKNPSNRHSFWLLLLGLTAGPGCRRTAPEPQKTPAESSASVRRLCAALHQLPAERKSACCGRPTEAPLFDECERVTLAALKAGAISLDSAALADCEREMQAALGGCNWVTPANPQGPAVCQRAIVARRGAGEACRSSLECRGPLHCAAVGVNGAGVCEPPAELGAACGVATDVLAAYTVSRGLDVEHPLCQDFCALTSHQCEPLPALGSACRASVNCGPAQRCRDGQCVAAAAAEANAPLAKPQMQCTASFDSRAAAGTPQLALPATKANSPRSR